jgi:hypothetical protein
MIVVDSSAIIAHSGEFDQAFRRNPISRSGQSDQSDAGA